MFTIKVSHRLEKISTIYISDKELVFRMFL